MDDHRAPIDRLIERVGPDRAKPSRRRVRLWVWVVATAAITAYLTAYPVPMYLIAKMAVGELAASSWQAIRETEALWPRMIAENVAIAAALAVPLAVVAHFMVTPEPREAQ